MDDYTLIDNLVLSENCIIPSNAKRIFFRININTYVASPLFEFKTANIQTPGRYTVIWGYLNWFANFEVSINSNTNTFTWEAERTLGGSKTSTWNTGINVYYSK